MDYKGYRINENGNKLVVENIRDFDPVHIFECGQCFRWLKEKDGSYTGVVGDRVVNIKMEDTGLVLENSGVEDFQGIWFDYLDLGTDYGRIKVELSKKDEIMRDAVKFGAGIRLLKQDIWETLISFIISANNRIPRIMKTVEVISEIYGREINYNGKSYYTFPDAGVLSDSSIEKLSVCKGGFRCKYIYETSRAVRNMEIDLDGLKGLSTHEAKSELMKLPGVGPKVADCILLYSGTKYDVFPTDVWVKRVMEELYFKRTASFKEIWEFSKDYFGEYSGIAQQYLFYYARENRIGTK